jgi:UDP-glucose 4-epimerase
MAGYSWRRSVLKVARILVTGGAGYVGSVCCLQLLERGHQVAVVDDLSTGHREAVPEGAVLHQVDIGDRAAMAKVFAADRFDAVFHFAAKALIPESVSNPGLFFDSNVASGIALLEAVRSAGIRKFVFSSSAAVYGNPHSTPIDEDHPKNPVNSYGETKLMLERALYWYAMAYGWTVVAFRYFNACGATTAIGEDHCPETHIIPLLLETAAGERDFFEIYGYDYSTVDGTCLRDYVHVLDIAEAHLLALQLQGPPGLSAYNIGTGTSYSVRQVCRVVEQELSRKVAVKDGNRRDGDPAILCASPQRLMRELGWRPRFSDLQNIVRTAWEWKQQHPQGYAAPEPEPAVLSRS